MNFQCYKFYVQMRSKLGVNATGIHNEFKQASVGRVPSYDTIVKWIAYFKKGGTDLKHQPRSGRPITASIQSNIEMVAALIEEDPYLTYKELVELTSLSAGTLNTIIHQHLKLRKIVSRFVPYDLTEQGHQKRVDICKENLEQIESGKWRLPDIITGDESWFYWRPIGRKQSNRSWVAKGESPKTIVKPSKFDDKTMVCVFFRTNGVESISYFKKGETITHRNYIDNCLKPLVNSLKKSRPSCGTLNLKFHHDNARPHVHQMVITFLQEQNLKQMKHPPYSPDLAPSDFWLFDYIKQRLDSHNSAESLVKQITKICQNIPKEEYRKTFERWIQRMKLCIKYKGDYFEHIIKEN